METLIKSVPYKDDGINYLSRGQLIERLRDAETLVGSLDSFIFVARTDRRPSPAVEFAASEVEEYRKKWSNAAKKSGDFRRYYGRLKDTLGFMYAVGFVTLSLIGGVSLGVADKYGDFYGLAVFGCLIVAAFLYAGHTETTDDNF